ncbi:hypothetical protein SDC9_04013 [bioreactor metagenome]|uniref:Uncharacterized protein n=1 Tax=bioreactor metagenome TaxID=1076179 RepID=A0A644SUW0_9ZZZZ
MGFIRILKDDLVCYRIVQNGCPSSEYGSQLAEAIAGLYRPLAARLSFSRRGIRFERKDYISWEIELKNGQVHCYLICPERLARFLALKIHHVWGNATIEQVRMPAVFDYDKAAGCELRYKRQDIFSLNTDDETGTVEMARKIAQGLTGQDRAVVQVIFEPINQIHWKGRACSTYSKFLRGRMTMPSHIEKGLLGRCFSGSLFAEMIRLVFKASGCQSISEHNEPTAESRLLLLRKAADPRKPEGLVVRTFIRIAVQSPDQAKVGRTINAIVVAYKQLNRDNELSRSDESSYKRKFIKDINLRRPPYFRMNGNMMSLKECTKLMDLN